MSRVPVRDPSVVWRDEPAQKDAILRAQEAGEPADARGWVLLVVRGEMHELNLVAGEIWCLCDGTRDLDAVARELAGRYEAPLEEIRRDVDAFVADGVRRGWLRLVGGDG